MHNFLTKHLILFSIQQMLWKRTLQLFALPATNLLRIEIYGLIARFFDFYFGLAGSTTPVIRKDLRFDANFFKILQVRINSYYFFEIHLTSHSIF